jgi:Lrp/AsnC family leucine-responsive transcriptional regulator
MAVKLDEVDIQLLAALQADADRTNVELARLTGLSPAATLHRVRALKESGVIRIIRAHVDPGLAGFPLQVWIAATLTRHGPRSDAIFEDHIRSLPQVIAADSVAGETDYLLSVVARDVAELAQVLASLSGRGGQRLVTYLRLAEVKPPCGLPLTGENRPVSEAGLPWAAPGPQDLSCSILSRNRVVAIVVLRGCPRRNAPANFLAWSYSTLPGSGGSSGFTFTSTRAGPSCLSAWLSALRTSLGWVTLRPSAPLAVAIAV